MHEYGKTQHKIARTAKRNQCLIEQEMRNGQRKLFSVK